MRGNSGCVVERWAKCPHMVIKHCNNTYPINRLMAQADKQRWFYSNGPLPCPKVLGTTNDGGYGFLMDYEDSDDIFSYNDEQLTWFVQELNNYFYWLRGDRTYQRIPKYILDNKIMDIQVKTNIHIPYTFNSINIPRGWCHGDLTLDNMLPQFPDGLVLIDFLDSFIESPWMDIVKLRQDTKHKWILRNGGSKRQHDILDYLDDCFRHLICPRRYVPLQILNLARILPYANSSERTFLMKEIECLIQTSHS